MNTFDNSNSTRIAGVILAAGESRRMGRDKALLEVGEQTFLEHLAATLDGEVEPVLVVLGHHADQIERQVRLPTSARILRNPDYPLGQLSSLHVALRFLGQKHIDGIIVCLVDHPGVTKQVIRILRNRFQQSGTLILIPTCRARRGHPVLFSSKLFPELLAAPLDQGARAVVRSHAHEVHTVELDDEGILWDLDRPEDYAAFKRRWESTSRAALKQDEERA